MASTGSPARAGRVLKPSAAALRRLRERRRRGRGSPRDRLEKGGRGMKIGLAWYQERDYPAILEIMEDSNRLPATFASWLAKAEQSEGALTTQGHIVVRAM